MSDAKSKAAQFLMSQHHQICFERGDHPQEIDTAYSFGADALYRANLPPTDKECLRNEKVRALVEALKDMRRQFSPYPSEDTERWREEHEACQSADAALAALSEVKE
jgi:hypothetical protein